MKQINDPDLNKDIATLGFVKNIVISGKKVALDVELTTPGCPIKAQFKEQVEELVLALDVVSTVEATMTSSPQPQRQAQGPENSQLGKV